MTPVVLYINRQEKENGIFHLFTQPIKPLKKFNTIKFHDLVDRHRNGYF